MFSYFLIITYVRIDDGKYFHIVSYYYKRPSWTLLNRGKIFPTISSYIISNTASHMLLLNPSIGRLVQTSIFIHKISNPPSNGAAAYYSINVLGYYIMPRMEKENRMKCMGVCYRGITKMNCRQKHSRFNRFHLFDRFYHWKWRKNLVRNYSQFRLISGTILIWNRSFLNSNILTAQMTFVPQIYKD